MENKNKAKTLIERFGFNETELSTPRHDEMLLWLMNVPNCAKMLEELKIVKKVDYFCRHTDMATHCDWNFETESCSGICADYDKENAIRQAKEAYRVLRTVSQQKKDLPISLSLEYAILGSNNWNIGFVDAKITYKKEGTVVDGYKREIYGTPHKHCHFSHVDFEGENHVIFVEIKPQVRSIGELIRQINFYRSHCGQSDKWIVLTSTKNLRDILRTQNIYVYEFPSECKLQ